MIQATWSGVSCGKKIEQADLKGQGENIKQSQQIKDFMLNTHPTLEYRTALSTQILIFTEGLEQKDFRQA